MSHPAPPQPNATPCPVCEGPVFGRANKVYCSTKCRRAAEPPRLHPEDPAVLAAARRLLVNRGERHLRDYLRGVLAEMQAAGLYRGERDRLRVRF